jgi:5-carboxymethyl-2-hydroxymuconate isomerase
MPHIRVEYSSNLATDVDIRALIDQVHAAVIATGVFEVAAVRTRAIPREIYRIADGSPDHVFVHVDASIAPGRDAPARKRVAQAILDTVATATRGIAANRGVALSVEIREIDNSAALRLNNLHERLRAPA